MAISPISRQRSDPGLAADIARSALQTVLQEQDARGSVIARAQRMNQEDLRRQDQVMRDVQHGYFNNRQFAADEEQRNFRNSIIAAEEDRAAQKFEADMNLRKQIDPLKVASYGRSGTGGSGGSSLSSLGQGPSAPGVSGGSHAQVAADFNAKFGEGQEPYVPSFAGMPAQGTPPDETAAPAEVIQGEGPAIPAAIPRPGPSAPAPGSAAMPEQVLPVSPYQKLGQAEQSASEAASEIQQEVLAEAQAIAAPDEQQMAAIYFQEPGPQREAALEYYTAYNRAQEFKAQKEREAKQMVRKDVAIAGANYGSKNWNKEPGKLDSDIINNLTDKEKLDYESDYIQAAQVAATKTKGKPLSGSEIEDIRKSFPSADPKKLEAEANSINSVIAAEGLKKELQAAKSPAQKVEILKLAAQNDLFGATENERAAAIEAVYQSAEKTLAIPDPGEIQEAIDALAGTERLIGKDGKYTVGAGAKSGARGSSEGLSVTNAKLLNENLRIVNDARDAGLLLPNGQINEAAFFGEGTTPLGQPSQVAPPKPNTGPVGAPGSGDVRNLLGSRSSLTQIAPTK
jgi:hypothetical protein